MKIKITRRLALNLSLALGLFAAPAVFARNGVDHSKTAALDEAAAANAGK